MKVVVNKCYGGFGLSFTAQKMICEKKGIEFYPYKFVHDKDSDEYYYKLIHNENEFKKYIDVVLTKYMGEKFEKTAINNNLIWNYYYIERTDKALVETVEELGEKANGCFSRLEIVEIPDDINYEIREYDGYESIEEVHRTW